MTVINKELFDEKFSSLNDGETFEDLPETFEELFATQIDPCEFVPDLEILIKTTQHVLGEKIKNNTVHFENYRTDTPHEAFVLLGNMKVSGNFYLDMHTYILGDLEVDGVIFGNIHCILVVGGNIKCRGMLLCRTYLFANGEIMIEQCAMAVAYGFMMIREKLSTPVYIQDDTWMVCDVSEDAGLMTKSNLKKVKSKHLFEEKNFKDVEFIKKIQHIFGQENIEIDENGMWVFDNLFVKIGNKQIFLT